MKPAINVGLSVSRVGSAAQIKLMKQVAGTMKLDLAQYRELQAFAQFSSDLDDRTKKQLARGGRVNAVLKQGWDTPLKVEEQAVVIFAATRGLLDTIDQDKIPAWEIEFISHMRTAQKKLLAQLVADGKFEEKTEAKLQSVIKSFNETHYV